MRFNSYLDDQLTIVPLTPMIDIITILIAFFLLLQSSSPVPQPPGDITLPFSKFGGKDELQQSTVTLSKSFLYADNLLILRLSNGELDKSTIASGIIPALKRHLEEHQEANSLKQNGPTETKQDKKESSILLIADRTIPYATVRKVLRTGADAGYTRVYFQALRK